MKNIWRFDNFAVKVEVMVRVLFVFIFSAGASIVSFAASDLPAGGLGAVSVVVSASSDLTVDTAADELCGYLGKVLGRQVPRIAEGSQAPAGKAIYLGRTAFAAKKGIDFSALGEEEWLYRESDGALVIGGGGRRGALYGVYHYLEDELGVHWFSPSVEVVPKKDVLDFSGLDRRGKPVFSYRDIYFVTGPNASSFLARNRMNTENAAYGGRMRYSSAGSCHTLYRYLGSPKQVRELFAKHPEYFPLIDGKRTLDPKANSASKTQLCLTDRGLREHFVECLKKHIASDRAEAKRRKISPPMYYAIDQNDCYDGFCRCPSCAEIIDREGTTAGLLLEFSNFVAGELEKDAPEATFQMMAYFSTENPPRHVRPRHNVGIRLCDPQSDLTRTWQDPANAWMREKLEAWSGICRKIAVWDYQITYGSSTCTGYPLPNEKTFACDLGLLAKHGGEGVFFEHEGPIAADMRDMKVWLEMKLAENPHQNIEKLIKCFTDGFYGDAAPYVRHARNVLHRAAREKNAKVLWFPSVGAYDFIDGKTAGELDEAFAKAELAVSGDKELVERVRHARLSFDKLLIVRGDTSAIGRYRTTWEREIKRRFSKNAAKSGYKKSVETFLKCVAQRERPAIPARFADVPRSDVCIMAASRGTFDGRHMQLIPDESSSMLEAARFVFSAVKDRYPEKAHLFDWPFRCEIRSGADGAVKVYETQSGFAGTPEGYNWHKLAGCVKLSKDSILSIFGSYTLQIGNALDAGDGAAFDIYANLRILRSDVVKTLKPSRDAIYLLDQIAIVKCQTKEGGK